MLEGLLSLEKTMEQTLQQGMGKLLESQALRKLQSQAMELEEEDRRQMKRKRHNSARHLPDLPSLATRLLLQPRRQMHLPRALAQTQIQLQARTSLRQMRQSSAILDRPYSSLVL